VQPNVSCSKLGPLFGNRRVQLVMQATHYRTPTIYYARDLVEAGGKYMAVVRHFAINLVRDIKDERSIKTRRNRASWTRATSRPSSQITLLSSTALQAGHPGAPSPIKNCD
jgi:hypothetical protein